MSQDIFASIDPAISGTELATTLNNFKDALVSGLSGTSRPAELEAGGYWIDTTNDPTTWSYRLYTGTDDVEVFTIDVASGGAGVSLAVDSFVVRKVSADDVGAILDLVKRRIATSGQVLSGDVVGEIRITGRTNSATNPVVAKIIFTADENQTTTAFGGTLAFWSTPEGSATLTEHLRFIEGIVETIVPHKLNAVQLVSQNVATTATIAQLDATKAVVEMTGATATDIQGINAAQATKQISIHNRSSAIVTLKHQSLSAAAADRLSLPSSLDIEINPEETVTLIYSDADTRWKSQYRVSQFGGFTTTTLWGRGSLSVPASQVFISGKKQVTSSLPTVGSFMFGIDAEGRAYSWGANSTGDLGLGDVTYRSSPVAVLGGLRFKKIFSNGNHVVGLTSDGTPYSWGNNNNGQLGVGDITSRSSPVAVLGGLKLKAAHPSTPAFSFGFFLAEDGTAYGAGTNAAGQLGVGDVTKRSSPVAVLGGLKFREIVAGTNAAVGLTLAGVPYAWGVNNNGQLGLGDVTSRSSPVLVLGSLTFKKVLGDTAFIGITDAGALYAWGVNTNGQLGVGDVTPRSSPVAVLGGLTFRDVFFQNQSNNSVIALTEAGVAYSWGLNSFGQLGLGDVVPRSSPVAVLGGHTFRHVRTSANSSYGINLSGALYAWGENTAGQLALGDVAARSSPVAVLGGLAFKQVIVNASAGLALSESNVLYAWGSNTGGQLGLGDVTSRSSPVAVLGGLTLSGLFDPSSALSATVTPGTVTYALGDGPCYFDGKYIGKDISEIVLSYAN